MSTGQHGSGRWLELAFTCGGKTGRNQGKRINSADEMGAEAHEGLDTSRIWFDERQGDEDKAERWSRAACMEYASRWTDPKDLKRRAMLIGILIRQAC